MKKRMCKQQDTAREKGCSIWSKKNVCTSDLDMRCAYIHSQICPRGLALVTENHISNIHALTQKCMYVDA